MNYLGVQRLSQWEVRGEEQRGLGEVCSSKIPENQIGTGAGSLTRTWGSSFTTKRTVQYEPYNSQNTEDAIYRFFQKMMSEGMQDRRGVTISPPETRERSAIAPEQDRSS